MKKIVSSITVFFSLIVFAHAQNSSPYWSLSGNSNASSSSKLGTTNAINLRLFTNNAERMRITSSGLVGIGTTAPTSKLQINSTTSQDPLRIQVDGNTKLLANRNGGIAIGANSTPPANGLFVSGNVGIGTNTPSYKLHVVGGATITQGLYVPDYGTASYNYTGSWGTYSYGKTGGSYSYGPTYGIYASGTASSGSYGVYATGGSYGVYGSGYYGLSGVGTYGVYGSGTSFGMYGYSSDGNGVRGYSSSNYGVYGTSYSNIGGYFNSTTSHGIWAKTSSTATNIYAGVFEGKVYTYNTYQTSDKNLKKNIQEFGDAMSIINKLKPKKYEFRDDGKYASLQLPKGNHYGLLAQDLEQVLPSLVNEAPLVINSDTKTNNEPTVIRPTADGAAKVSEEQAVNQLKGTTEILNTKAVNYTELIPIMIKAMQEQAAKIEELTQLVNKLSRNPNTTGSVKPTESFLSQSTPNPNSNSTRINYNILSNTAKAELVITNAAGQKIKQIALNNTGSVEIDTSAFSIGTYFYSLYFDGSLVETKKMMVNR